MNAQPAVEHALNLADTLAFHNAAHALRLLDEGGYARVYLGAYFCEQYLLAQRAVVGRVLDELLARRVRATLVLPVAAERHLAGVIGFLDEVSSHPAVDEITCNDLGLLHYCATRVRQRLNAGRLLSRDVREPREPGFVQMPGRPDLLERDLAAAFAGCRVQGLEFDPTHALLDLRGAPGGVTCAVHADWCYITTGKICQTAALGVSVERKFRPSAPCDCRCLHYVLEHPAAAGAPAYVTHGRTTYYPQPDLRVLCDAPYRLIHPALLEHACRGVGGEVRA